MPNSANKSNENSNSGQGQRHHPSEQQDKETQNANTERSDIKRGTNESDGNTSRTSSQGRKEASGGDTDDDE